MTNEAQSIVIVGGGMVGVSLALLLSARLSDKSGHGVTITLVEKFAFPVIGELPQYQPSFDDRATVLSAGSVNILKKIGCWSALKKYAEAIESVHVSDRGHWGGIRLDAADYIVDALGYVVENRWFGRVLLNQLQQSDVECLSPFIVEECLPKKQGYRVVVRNNSEDNSEGEKRVIAADLLLIADGAESPLRQSLGIDVNITDYHQSALIANISLEKNHRNIAYERFTDEGPIALLPLKPIDHIERAALVWTLPSAKCDTLNQADKSYLLHELQQRFGFRAGYITDIGQCHSFPLKLVEVAEQVRSHLAIIGNAAHFLHPVAGQGFNLALRDNNALSHCLQTAYKAGQPLGHYRVLQQFYEQQQLDQQMTVGITHYLIKLFSSKRFSLTVLRQLGFLSLTSLPLLKRKFAHQMMGMH